MIENLSMVTRVVADQDQAVTFYMEKLGFELRRDHPGPHGRFVTVAPETDERAELVLVTPDGFEEGDAERFETLIGSGFGLIYEVDDCWDTYETLRERGVEFRDEPEEQPWGTQVVAFDPDGNEIVLQEPVSGGEF